MTLEHDAAGAHDADGSPAGAEPTSPARRRALVFFGVLTGSLATLAAGIPVVGYLIAPAFRRFRRRDAWVTLGRTSEFPPNSTRLVEFENPVRQPWDGQSARMAAYVRCNKPGDLVVFSINCTHLGCPVSWFPQSGLFLCPCHGGAYYENGQRAAGPPPRGLYHYPQRVENGRLMVKVGHLPTLQDPGTVRPAQGSA